MAGAPCTWRRVQVRLECNGDSDSDALLSRRVHYADILLSAKHHHCWQR